MVSDLINNTRTKFNASVDDTFIWTNNKNGSYTNKSGYDWLLSINQLVVDITSNHSHSWSWIWKFKLSKKFKFLFWLASHDVVRTLSLLHHRSIVPSAICSHYGIQDESFLHFVRRYNFSRTI